MPFLFETKAFSKFLCLVTKLESFILFVIVMAVGLIVASLDPFLHVWDEAFHALVAKRMAINPLHPQLYTVHLTEFNPTDWSHQTTWLHKQPFFLWLMAISIKILGSNVFAVRLPSVIAHAFSAVFMASIGSKAINKQVGIGAGILFGFSNFFLELMAGTYSVDHNDTIFFFCVSGAFWAWFNYQEKQKISWAIAIALFSGFAVLTKWLTGMIAIGGWFMAMVLIKENRDQWKDWLLSIGLSALIFIPWQVYILIRFPETAKYEFEYNSRHLTEAIEGHDGDAFYYWDRLQDYYFDFEWMPILLVSALIWLFVKLKPTHRWFALSTTVAVFGVFTLAKTKMMAFGILPSTFFFIAIAFACFEITKLILKSKPRLQIWIYSLLIFVGAFSGLKTDKMFRHHSLKSPDFNDNREGHFMENETRNSLSLGIPDEQVALLNCELVFRSDLNFMFFRDFAVAYDQMPTKSMIDSAINLKIKPVVFERYEPLPVWIWEDERIKIVTISGKVLR